MCLGSFFLHLWLDHLEELRPLPLRDPKETFRLLIHAARNAIAALPVLFYIMIVITLVVATSGEGMLRLLSMRSWKRAWNLNPVKSMNDTVIPEFCIPQTNIYGIYVLK